ncbi:MAG: sugar phosphate isomerase/epimerase [Bernardetiaceae bacterium]|nr:sugar phosphate isomerase/epimerase [Bernardetiaceae bacterium]
MKDHLTRRTFLGALSATAATVLAPTSLARPGRKPAVKVLATNWGFPGNYDAFCAKAKETGYDGIEVWPGREKKAQDELLAAVAKHGLSYAFLVGVGDSDPAKHLANFTAYLREAAALKPLFINCHCGRDYFTFAQNKALIEAGLAVEKETGIRVSHETHRGRWPFAAHITKTYLDSLPSLKLTLDISHWCNVHESLLDDQPEAVQAALTRTVHIHTRVGHPEGPQVNDPRAPEWEKTVAKHFAWWDQAVEAQTKAGATVLTFTPEFGPPTYLPALPYSQMPVANQWEINAHLMKLVRQRYA